LIELLKLAEMTRSTFYYWLNRIKKEDKYKEIKKKICDIFNKNHGRYGYRRITIELKKQGYVINHKTVLKLMKSLGLQGIVSKRKRYNSYRGTIGKVADNCLKRDFKASHPNEKWVTDVTEFKIKDRKLYLSPIIDLYNGEVVSFNLSYSPNYEQIQDMLDKAFAKIPDNTNLILHSDQGWLYQISRYQEKLKSKGIIQSMSRKGNCLDNACAENFFSILKRELYYVKIKQYSNIEELREDIIDYIYYYNNYRIKTRLDGMSPVQYRLQTIQS